MGVVVGGSGLGRVEGALLDAVDLVGTDGEPVQCSEVLAVVAVRDGVESTTAYPTLVQLGSWWRRHLPLVELLGNAGTPFGDGAADPEHVDVRLSSVGSLALAAERGELGPLPLALIEGTWWSGGEVPPFDPRRVVGALLAAADDAGGPVLPTGGRLEGNVDALLRGDAVRLTVAARIVPEGGHLVVTELPYGVSAEDLVAAVHEASHAEDPGTGLAAYRRGCPVRRVSDESTDVDGVRIRVELVRGADLLVATHWLRGVPPVAVERDAQLPAPMPDLLSTWDRGDGTGLRALADLLTSRVPPPDPLLE